MKRLALLLSLLMLLSVFSACASGGKQDTPDESGTEPTEENQEPADTENEPAEPDDKPAKTPDTLIIDPTLLLDDDTDKVPPVMELMDNGAKDDVPDDIWEVQLTGDDITVQNVRYHFEHKLLPHYFYQAPYRIMTHLLSKSVMYSWQKLCNYNEIDPTYNEKDTKTSLYFLAGDGEDDDLLIERVVLPEPDQDLLCYRIYLLYDVYKEKAVYYTIESDKMTNEMFPYDGGEFVFVCSWDEDGSHYNYGTILLADSGDDAAMEKELAIIYNHYYSAIAAEEDTAA